MEGSKRMWKRVEESGREWKIAESGRERMGGGGMEREEDSGRERKPEEREEEKKMQNP